MCHRMTRLNVILIAIIAMLATIIIVPILGIMLLVGAIGSSMAGADTHPEKPIYTHLRGNPESENKILVVPIHGIILDNVAPNSPTDWFSYIAATYGYEVKQILQDAAYDPSVRGVVLEIKSPGGTINGSKAISDGIDFYRKETNNPVIAHIEGTGASGAYWVATSANAIIVDYGSLLGSIGVITGPFKYYDDVVAESGSFSTVQTIGGIETSYIYAGKYKNFGTPYEEMPGEAREIFQQGVNREYDLFVKHVAESRNISEERIREEIGGMIYSASQAVDLKLADKAGSRESAYRDVAKRAELSESDYQLVTIERSLSFFESMFGVHLQTIFRNGEQQSPIKPCVMCNQLLFLHGDPAMYMK